ncbi:MAG: pantoate--beta-alanine ligase [Pseudohongiellaceae bacterium]|jgi:pantoate--beta-alanine ligase
MDIIDTKAELKTKLDQHRTNGEVIGLVPTMGNLHDGHISLIEMATSQCEFVVSSIFVNPLQFGKGEDLAAYPRTLAEDCSRLAAAGCNLVFTPTVAEMYSQDLAAETIVHVPGVSENYCGKSRPGHFDGVTTIVSKLFHMVLPHRAYFGLKDYQQFLVISKMVRDLAMPIEILGLAIKREPSGLAMSSRNNFLSAAERATAATLNRVLEQAKDSIIAGSRDFSMAIATATAAINSCGMATDYFAVCNADDLSPADPSSEHLVILAAAYLGGTRLIDNVRFSLTQRHSD